MKELRISIYKGKAPETDVTIVIPFTALKIVNLLAPKKLRDKMDDEGIDLQEIIKAAEVTNTSGKLLEMQDKDGHIVVSVTTAL